MSGGSKLRLCYPKVTVLSFQRKLFMIKGVSFANPPKDFLKLVSDFIYNPGSTCITIIYFTCQLYIKQYDHSSDYSAAHFVCYSTDFKELFSPVNLNGSKFSTFCSKPSPFEPQKLYTQVHNMQNALLNQK